eukprot:COSAG06_NODE_1106_length_10684_cov_5.383656_2_plen_101_part_00
MNTHRAGGKGGAKPPLALSARGAGGPTLSGRTTQLNGLELGVLKGHVPGLGRQGAARCRAGAVHTEAAAEAAPRVAGDVESATSGPVSARHEGQNLRSRK